MSKNCLPGTIALLFIFLQSLHCYGQKQKILFIGNSYTTYDGYNIPRKVKKLAKASGHKVLIRQHTKNGRTLQHHLQDRHALKKISKHPWNYVVLQEQQYTIVANAERGMYPAVREFATLIHRQGGRTLLYEIMPKEFSREAVLTYSNDSVIYYYKVFKDFAHARDSLQRVHASIAREIGASTSPVGRAFEMVLAAKPELKLFKKDKVHHSREGAYLAACVLYATLLGDTPVGNPYLANLPLDQAQFFQRIAAQAVLIKEVSGRK